MTRERARFGDDRPLSQLTRVSVPAAPFRPLRGWKRAGVNVAAALAPAGLTAAIVLLPDEWPRPYSWQYLGLVIAAALVGETVTGLIALAAAIVALVWLGLMTPLHPGVEMFVAIGVSLLVIGARFRRTQQQLRERAAVLQCVIEAMPDAVYVGTAEGVALCNTNALRMLGARSLDDLRARIGELGRKFAIRWPDSGRRLREDELQFTRALGGETVVEEVLATNAETGTDVYIRSACAPILDEGLVIGAVAINSDLTDRKRAQEALSQSEQRFRRTLDAMLEGCAIIAHDWTYLYVNEIYAKHARLTRGELMGRTVGETSPGFEDSVFFAAFRRCMVQRTPESVESEYLFPDGVRRWYEGRVRPVPEGIFVLSLDVTDRKHAEQAVEAARLAAERARAAAEEANLAKDHFLAVLSHELRTPLTPVLAGVALLKRDPTLSDRSRGYVEVVRRNVEIESRLIDDLLDVTRIAHGKIELNMGPADLRAIIARAVEVCLPDIDARQVHFGVDFNLPDPCFIEADAARLQQVFWNLLKNAIKFTPKGGCVGIRSVADGEDAIVEINDSGVGIAPADLDTIFNAFAQAERTLRRQFGGLGLGLTISRALVERHGGTITAHSGGAGKGASFRVRLPLLPLTSHPIPRAARDQRRRPRSGRRLRVLLVEDHGDTARMLVDMLEQDGHHVETSGDVASALEAAARGGFDLLVSDLGLPDRSGLELMRELRMRGDAMPGIAVSGYGHEEDVRRSLAAGFSTHLVKPVEMGRLLEAIDASLAT